MQETIVDLERLADEIDEIVDQGLYLEGKLSVVAIALAHQKVSPMLDDETVRHMSLMRVEYEAELRQLYAKLQTLRVVQQILTEGQKFQDTLTNQQKH